jgi:hydrogenase maturation protease
MRSVSHAPRGGIVVIGYGNPLRSDDSAGPRAAEAIAAWRLPGVWAIGVRQLTPELAEPLSAARVAIFVDARLAEEGGRVRVRAIEPEGSDPAVGHASDPRSLLAFARALFGSDPRAWLVTVPATNLAVGEGLSPTAERGLAAALRTIAALVELASWERQRRIARPETICCDPVGDGSVEMI